MNPMLCSMILFCANYYNNPNAIIERMADSWLHHQPIRQIAEGWSFGAENTIQNLDLNGDGTTNLLDFAILSRNWQPMGWTVCEDCKDHLYKNCPAIVGRTDTTIRVIKNPCLKCTARRIAE